MKDEEKKVNEAEEEGVELTDEELEQVVGGNGPPDMEDLLLSSEESLTCTLP